MIAVETAPTGPPDGPPLRLAPSSLGCFEKDQWERYTINIGIYVYDDAEVLAYVLSQPVHAGAGGRLKEIKLMFNRIGDRGARALARALISNAALTSLNLSGNRVGDPAIGAAIGKAIERNKERSRQRTATLDELDQGREGEGKSGEHEAMVEA